MDVYSAIEPIFFPSKILGLSPMRLVGITGSRTLQRSSQATLYSCCVATTLLLTKLYHSFVLPRKKPEDAVDRNLDIIFIFDVFLAVFIILASCVYATRFSQFMSSVDRIDKLLSSLSIPFRKDHASLKRNSLIRLVANILLWSGATVLISIATYTYLVSKPYNQTYDSVVFWSQAMASQFINFWYASVFVECVSLVKYTFELINQKISAIIERNANKLFTVVKASSVVKTVRLLQYVHFNLSKQTKQVNAIFALPLLFYISSAFANVACSLNNCFASLLKIYKNQEVADNLMAFVVFELYMTALFVLQLASIALTCDNASSELATKAHKMDVYSAVEPVFYPSRLLGLAPTELLGEVGNRKLHRTTTAILYSCFVVGAMVATNLFLQKYSNVSEYSSMNNIVVLILYNCDVYLAMFVIFMQCVRAKNYAKFMSGVDLVDSLMMSILMIDFNKEQSSLRRHAFIRIILMSLLYLLAIMLITFAGHYFATNSDSANAWAVTLYWGLSLTAQIINCLFTCSFTHCVYVLKDKFRLINKKITEFSEPDLEPIRYFDKQNKIIAVKSIKTVSEIETLQKIQSLHCNLCDLAKEINDIFSMQLLLYIATVFTRVTGGLNNCFEDLRKLFDPVPKPGTQSLPRIIYELYIVIIFIVQVTSIALYCAITISEANQTPVLVHALMAETKDTAIKDQLELFSLQLLHRKVQFSACGFFPIDATLLYSIVGGVTTYLVILIQFQLSETSPKPANATQTV